MVVQQLGRRDDEGRTKAFAAPSLLDDANKIAEMAADSFILLWSIIALQEVGDRRSFDNHEKQPSESRVHFLLS